MKQETVVTEAQKILGILEGLDSFMAIKTLECAKTLYESHSYLAQREQVDQELERLGGR